jgi:flagellar biosynthesis protein
MNEERPSPSPYSPLPPRSRAVAVALGADEKNPDGPAKILATGRGKLAEEILALAFAKGIKVRADADLAELLVQLELDSPIPTEAVVAVAEILAKVYEANLAAASSVEPS